MVHKVSVHFQLLAALLGAVFGCGRSAPRTSLNIVDFNPNSATSDWQATDVFTDPRTVECAEAVKNGDLAKIDALVQAGVDIQAEGKHQLDQLSWALLVRNKASFQRLLKKGADPNHRVLGAIPLVYLTSRNGIDSEWLELLLKSKADPNAEFGMEKEVPLAGAIFYASGPKQQNNIKLLIQAGADLDHRDHTDNTPAMLAFGRRRYDLAYLLLQAGASYRNRNKNGCDLMYQVIGAEIEPGTDDWIWREKIIDFLWENEADFKAAELKMADDDPQKLETWKKHLVNRANRQ